MAAAAAEGTSGKVVIRNIGLLLSGDIDKPVLDADTIVVHDGLINAVGKQADCNIERVRTTIDARQTCVAQGLIDSHVHPVFGDWTPRQNQLGWIEAPCTAASLPWSRPVKCTCRADSKISLA